MNHMKPLIAKLTREAVGLMLSGHDPGRGIRKSRTGHRITAQLLQLAFERDRWLERVNAITTMLGTYPKLGPEV